MSTKTISDALDIDDDIDYSAFGVLAQDTVNSPPALSQTSVGSDDNPAGDDVENFKSDKAFARENMLRLIKDAMNFLPVAMQTAKDSESARHIEVLNGMFKTISEMNKDLINISEKSVVKSTQPGESDDAVGPTNIYQTAIFNGSTEDLIRKLFPRRDPDTGEPILEE